MLCDTYMLDAAGLNKIRTELINLRPPGLLIDSSEGAQILYDDVWDHIAIGQKYWMLNACRSVNCGQCSFHAFSGSTEAATALCSTCGCWLHTTSRCSGTSSLTTCYTDHLKMHQWQSFCRGVDSKREARAAEDVLRAARIANADPNDPMSQFNAERTTADVQSKGKLGVALTRDSARGDSSEEVEKAKRHLAWCGRCGSET
jgi:hypothetical protein